MATTADAGDRIGINKVLLANVADTKVNRQRGANQPLRATMQTSNLGHWINIQGGAHEEVGLRLICCQVNMLYPAVKHFASR